MRDYIVRIIPEFQASGLHCAGNNLQSNPKPSARGFQRIPDDDSRGFQVPKGSRVASFGLKQRDQSVVKLRSVPDLARLMTWSGLKEESEPQ